MTSATVETWGGGGGGGQATGNPAKGGGGAGGQFARKVVTVVPGTVYAIGVGAGGAGGTGTNGGSGLAGGDSTFAITTVVAKGGAGGAVGSVNGGTAAAGVGSITGGVGDTVYAGGSGSDGVGATQPAGIGGAGGGGAGSTGAGGSASGNTAGTGTAVGGGNGGAGRTTSGAGNAGAINGGGGGGGYALTATDRNGAAGARGQVTVTYTPSTILADGTNPANVTRAPGGAITDLDAFTLRTSSGTDSVTALTVTLTGANSFESLSEVRITNNAGTTTYFTAVANPASNTVSFSGGTPIPVTTTATTFKVRITPKTHANMPVPPGLSYAVGGTVTAFTSTNPPYGSDGASATVTVDNLSPAGATATSGTAGNASVTLNWTTSASTDFNTTSGSVILRWATTAGAEVPVEGSTYAAGNTIGTAFVACVISSAASTPLTRINGTGGSAGCSTTALVNGTTYIYKVFQKDLNGNYDTGVTIGSFTPNPTTTLATGTDPAAATIAPGGAATDVDLFTLQTSSGTEAVTSITVNLSTNSGIGLLAITNNANTVLGSTAAPVAGSNTIPLTITATTTLTTYKVRVTPLSHAAMPAPPGGAYAITAPVTAWGGTYIHAGSDTNPNALTIDNLSPAGATATSGTASNASVTLNWTTSASTDFNTTSGSVILRWATTAGAEVPAEGSTYAAGDTIGTAFVACVISSAASTPLTRINGTGGSAGCSTTALANGTTYIYKVFQKDLNGNYDTGVTIGSFTPNPILPTATTNAATGVTSAVATLNGTVSSNGGATTVTFEYGLTAAYGASIAATPSPLAANDANILVSADLIGLNCNTVFHYRVVATNSAGTTNGLDGTFTTGGCTAPFPATACAATRFNNDLGCTANDVNITGIALAPSSIASCVSGSPVILDLDLTVNFASPDRWDIGIFIANDGKLPTLLPANGGASSCSVDILPTTPPFLDLDGVPQGTLDTCGDGNGSIDDSALPGGTVPLGDGVKRMTGVTLPCYASVSSGGQLFVPFAVSWDNQKSPVGNLCTSNLYPVPNTTSKCNAPASSVSIAVVVLPVITKTNGGTEINPGANTAYTVVINNNSGGTLQDVVFKDPAVTDPLTPLTVNSVSCAAAGGATCPAMTSAAMITAMQGAGITILSADLPNNGSLTFTINATLSAGATVGSHLINTASATVGGHTSTVADDDLIVLAPSVAMSFAPGTITEGSSSVLTITFTNPTASAVTGVSFTDTYPAGLLNTAAAGGATTCVGGTVTAANDGNSLALSGGTIPATGSCTVTVNVTSATAGSYFNSTGTVIHASGTISAASATLTVNVASGSFVFTDAACQHGIAFGGPGQTCSQVVTWPAQTAGVNATAVHITAVNASNVPTRLHASQARTRDMEFGLSCYDPIANAGVPATFAGATLPLCEANGATPTTWSSPVTTVTFPGGSPSSSVSYTFNYADVGWVELWMRNSAIPTDTGHSSVFVVKPAGFVLSNIKCTTVDAANCGAGALAMPMPGDNPGAANAAGVTFIRAGHPFSVTVTATASGGAPTPNYGKETTPEGVRFVDTSLPPADPNYANHGTLVTGLGLTNNPAIGGTFGAFANGAATGTAFTWNEAGIITLTPSVADANYLSAGDIIGTQSGNVGRFYPDHFTLSAGSITTRSNVSPACSPASIFSYMNEPFQAGFTLTATGPSPGNATLLNYVTSATPANNFAKLATDSPIPAGFGFAYLNATTDLSARIDSSLGISGSWSAGELAATTTLAFTRDTAPDGPYSAVKVGIAPVDSDSVALSVLDMDVTAPVGNDHAEVGQTQIRFGHLRLLNAYGSELLPLRVEYRAEYWDGNRWRTNTEDNCSGITADNVAKRAALPVPAISALSNGVGFITFAPTAVGAYDIALNLGSAANDASCNAVALPASTGANLSWLQGNWCGVAGYVRDPNARIKLGSPKAPYIYLRERY